MYISLTGTAKERLRKKWFGQTGAQYSANVFRRFQRKTKIGEERSV